MNISDFNQKSAEEILSLVNVPIQASNKASISFPLLKFQQLHQLPGIVHGFTTRMGGVSEGEFSSLNLSFTRGDLTDSVMENYKRLAAALGISVGQFVFTDQTHTTNVRVVGKEDCGAGILKERPYADVDGIITNEPGVMLAAFFADCVPLYFVDPVHKAIGLSHSGWRGTKGRMGAVTIQKMTECYGSNPKEMYVAIGPSICASCYEIGEDVATEFKETFGEQAEVFLKRKNEEKYELDLWKVNEIILLEAGITKEHLAVTNICTCCNPSLLFSHRASGGRRGNLGAFLMLS